MRVRNNYYETGERRGNSNRNCSAVAVCHQGMIWHGGQEGLTAEEVKLVGSKNVRERTTPCKGVKFAEEITNGNSKLIGFRLCVSHTRRSLCFS